jgi:hypothetical protein
LPAYWRGTGPEALFYDTDDHQLYHLTSDWQNHREIDATLLATFGNGVQLHTSDFIVA